VTHAADDDREKERKQCKLRMKNVKSFLYSSSSSRIGERKGKNVAFIASFTIAL